MTESAFYIKKKKLKRKFHHRMTGKNK